MTSSTTPRLNHYDYSHHSSSSQSTKAMEVSSSNHQTQAASARSHWHSLVTPLGFVPFADDAAEGATNTTGVKYFNARQPRTSEGTTDGGVIRSGAVLLNDGMCGMVAADCAQGLGAFRGASDRHARSLAAACCCMLLHGLSLLHDH